MENQNQAIGSDDTGVRASLLEIDDDATEAPEVVTEGISAISAIPATKVAGTGAKRDTLAGYR